MSDEHERNIQAIQYNGSNGAAVIALAEELSGLYSDYFGYTMSGSESGGQVTITRSSGSPFVLGDTDWLVYEAAGMQKLSDEVYGVYYRQVVPPLATVHGRASIPAIALGANTDVDVTLHMALADTGYSAFADLVGAAGNLTVNSATVIDTDTVRVNISASVAYVAGAQVLVTAYGTVA